MANEPNSLSETDSRETHNMKCDHTSAAKLVSISLFNQHIDNTPKLFVPMCDKLVMQDNYFDIQKIDLSYIKIF